MDEISLLLSTMDEFKIVESIIGMLKALQECDEYDEGTVTKLNLLRKMIVNVKQHEMFFGTYCNVINICLDILRFAHFESHKSDFYMRMIQATSELYGICIKIAHVPAEKISDILSKCCDSLEEFCKNDDDHGNILFETHENACFNTYCSIKILQSVITDEICRQSQPQNTNDSIIEAIVCTQPSMLSALVKCFTVLPLNNLKTILHSVIPNLLYFNKQESLQILIDGVYRLSSEESCDKNVSFRHPSNERSYLILCALADVFFNEHEPCLIDLRTDSRFWKLIQDGLWDENTVSRRRCVYLIKRIVDICDVKGIDVMCTSEDEAVFWWRNDRRKDLCKMWDDFVLLVETLEEKQMHIIEPLLPKMNSLLELSHRLHQDKTRSWPYLHSSWLVAIIRRTLIHQNPYIATWGLHRFLQIDLDLWLSIQQGLHQFMSTDLITALRHPFLYNVHNTGDKTLRLQSPMGELLLNHFTQCVQILDDTQRVNHFNAVLDSMMSVQWGSAALFYVTKALSLLPPCQLWAPQSLRKIREIYTRNHFIDLYARGSIEMCLIRLIIRHLNPVHVHPSDLSVTLSIFTRDDILGRGSLIWNEVVDWLKTISLSNEYTDWSSKNIVSWIDKTIKEYMAHDKVVSNGALPVARMYLMACDASIITRSTISTSLSHVTLIPHTINTHSYTPIVKAHLAIQFMTSLVEELGPGAEEDLVGKTILEQIKTCMEQIYMFLAQSLSSSEVHMSNIDMERYANNLTRLIPLDSSCHIMPLVKTAIQKLTQFYHTQQPTDVTHKKDPAMTMLATVCSSMRYRPDCPQQVTSMMCDFIQKYLVTPSMDRKSESAEPGVASSRLLHHWQCLHFLIHSRTIPIEHSECILELALDSLDLATGEIYIEICDCVRKLVPNLLSSKEHVILQIFTRAWRQIPEDLKEVYFKSELTAYINMVFQSATITAMADSDVSQHLLEACSTLYDLSFERPSVYDMLIPHLVHLLRHDTSSQSLSTFSDVMLQALLYTVKRDKSERNSLDLVAYITSLGPLYTSTSLKDAILKPDIHVRATVITFLLQLSPSNSLEANFVTNLIHQLCTTHKECLAKKNAVQYANSTHHFLRNHVVQVLLILVQFITENEMQHMWTYIWDTLTLEYQPSVRYLLEWLCLRLIYKFPNMATKLFTQLHQFFEAKNLGVISIMSVASHIGPHLQLHLQEIFYDEAIRCILPICMSHHFNSRIHAHATIIKLWQQCQQLKLAAILDRHSIVASCLHDNGTTQSAKSVQKLLSHFFYFTLDFVKDYSLQTIFETLPRLSCLAESEWITPGDFIQADSSWSHDTHPLIPLVNTSDALQHCVPGPWRLKVNDSSEQPESDEKDSGGDFQKKITPWRFMSSDDTCGGSGDLVKDRSDGLILVTSLIDKTPNLGGLCRTSEIFGVSEFVIGSLNYVEDRTFQLLSVTAHKWIPVTEVKKAHLREYLLHKKSDGYTLVGVEQTANSVCLTEYTFPKKSLLLLGNEKQGIPVDLIHLLDVCVEIPQKGVIRSLNVHVSGALFIWEYARQQLIK